MSSIRRTPIPTSRLRVPGPLRGLLLALLVALAATGAAEILWRARALDPLEAAVGDGWHRLRGHREHADRDVLLVRVDDETLSRHPEPFVFWAPLFARAIATLRDNGATVVGLDFLFAASAEGVLQKYGLEEASRTHDAPLIGQIAQGDVVLVASTSLDPEGEARFNLPLGPYRLFLPDPRVNLGLSDLVTDRDLVVRRWLPDPAGHPDAPLAFAAALVARHHGLDPAGPWTLGGRELRRDEPLRPIAWDGPPGAHPGLPMWKLLDPDALTEADRALIRGRIALVGADFTDNADVLPTPYGKMAGVEVHANVVAMLLSGDRLAAAGDAARLGIVAVASLLLALLAFRTTLPITLLGLLGLEVAWPVASYLVFREADLLLPTTPVAVAGLAVVSGAFALRFRREQQQRRFLRQVFERYVSDAVVADILSSPERLGLGGARREVTVLFSDIRSFTTISERLTPEEVVEMLNAYFGRVCRPILASGGVVDKFIGDAVLAVWGAPVGQPDHARRALQAAIAMSSEVDGFRRWMAERFPDRDLPPFDVGIGVHTGPAVVGNIGFERRTEYTVIGDAVNVASRVEGLTKGVGARILATREALVAAGSGVSTGRHAEMQVKGRSRPVEVFEVVGIEGG